MKGSIVMGLFGDLDVASAEDNPWAVPANTYEADLYKVEVKKDKNDNLGMSFVYKISSGEHVDKTVSEWKAIPQPTDPKNLTPEEKKAASYLKMRLSSLGVPESRMNSVEPEDLMGLPVVIKVTVNGEYTNVARVELRDANSAGAANGDLSSLREFKGFNA